MIGPMVSGSTNSVHSLLVSVAIDSHRLLLDLLKDLHAKILLKPLAFTPEGPPDPLVSYPRASFSVLLAY